MTPSREASQPAPLPGLTNVVLLEKLRETPRTVWYRALQEKLGREVLLKARPCEVPPRGVEGVISDSRGGPGGGTLTEEMVLLSRLHSDAIVAAIDASASGDWLYQMVELPPGEPLTRAFKERGRLPWEPGEALAIAERLAEALEHAHRAGVVLRRLHPEDIFLAPEGRVKLSSLEWAIGPGVSPSLPADLNWLAPEVAGGAGATPAADSYALGLLLAWLLTGREPPASGLRRADEKAVEALRARGVREELIRLVARFLDPSPDLRPGDGAEAREAIRAFREEFGRRRPARRAALLSGAGVLVLAIAAVAFTLSPRTRSRSAAPEGNSDPPAIAAAPSSPAGDPRTPEGSPEEGAVPPPSPPARSPSADGEAAAVQATAPSPPAPRPALLLEKERSDRRKEGQAAIAEFEARDLPGLLEKADFARATQALDALSARFPEEVARLDDLRKGFDAREKEASERLEAEVQGLLAAGDLEKARRRTVEGAGRLSPSRGARARSDLSARIAAVERERSESAARIAAVLARARQDFEAERFDEAASALAAAPAPEGLEAPIRALSREIAIAREAREAVCRGLDRAIAARTPVRSRVYGSDGSSSDPLELVLDERRESSLTAHRRGSTARMSLSLYDVEAAALEALAAPQESGGAKVKEGLLALLLSQGRPEVAAPLLAEAGLESPVEAAYAERLRAIRARRLPALAGEAAKRLEEVSGRKGSTAAWSDLKGWVAGIIARNAAEASFAERGGGDLERVFLTSAREALRSGVPERLFRGRLLKERRNGQIQVIYDFADSGQLGDWTALPGTVLAPAGKSIRLEGAMRYLKGNPFGSSMGVVVKVPAKGTSNPPHLGVVLGSWEGPPGTDTTPIALVLGFSPPKGGPLVVPHDRGTLEVSTPATGIFAGPGIPPDPDMVVCAVPTARHAGPLFFQAEMGPGRIAWTLNGKAVIPTLGEGAQKALSRFAPPEAKASPGSVSIFSLNEPATIEAIEVYGMLEERWVEERIAQLAQEELKAIGR